MNGTNDNGTLQGVTYSNGGSGYSSYLTFSQSFTYDKINRLATASDSGGWSRNFSYDSYGNMWVSGSSGIPLAGNTPTSNVYSTANRISGSSYDASGNQLAVNGDTATYDAENRLATVTESPGMGGGTETLVYDGNGKRVQKILPSGNTIYVYDAFGRLVSEYTTNPTEAPCWTCYLSYDHLGSVRMVTSGNLQLVARHDFLPFGEELPPNSAGRNGQWGPGSDNVTQKFTGQIREEETDLDYFNARYFGAALGRFTSPDPANAGANPMNPQSWNGYGYVLGNPLTNTDASGMDVNYAGFQQGVCPASQANCPMAGHSVVGTPTVPNEIDAAETRYVQEIVIPGFSHAPNLISSAPVNASGYSTSETIIYGGDLTKQISASSISTSDVDTFTVADLRISFYKGEHEPFGHVGIGVIGSDPKNPNATYGLYPANSLPIGPGVVQRDQGTLLNTYVIKTTQAQDNAVQSYANQSIKNPPKYNFFTHDCTDFVTGALHAAGISAPNYQAPKVFAQWLANGNAGAVCGR